MAPTLTGSRRPEVMLTLTKLAKLILEHRYASDGLTPRAYHNLPHSDDVRRAALRIGVAARRNGKVMDADAELLEIAAMWHDIEQELGRDCNEHASAEAICDIMKRSHMYEPAAIAIVRAQILSTRVSFESGTMIQLIERYGNSYLPLILADADLAMLGAPWELHWSRSELLMFELAGTTNPSDEQRRTFLENQLRLLESHVFHTPEAGEVFPHQADNALLTRQLLNQLG